MTSSDERLSEALDTYITAHQNGYPLPPVSSEAMEEAALAGQLLALAGAIQTDEMQLPALFARPASLSNNHKRPVQASLHTWWHGRRFTRKSPKVRRFAIPMLLLVALVSIVLASPDARALAQGILRFFQRSESDIVEVRLPPAPPTTLPAPATASATVDDSISATQAEIVPEATTIDTVPTFVPPSTVDDRFPLTLGEAAAEAGFPIKVPTYLPDGFEFRGARYDATRQAVEQYFVFAVQTTGPVMTAQFTLVQQPNAFDSLIGPSATIETVTIGGSPGEYVAGGWLYKPSGTQAESDGTVVQQFTWEPTMVPLQTLRWAEGGYYYEMAFIGSDTQGGYLVMEKLVSIASNMH
ncbi:MAG: hypothetical protein IT318_01420 [Anaerolineales bacterium]|nr:hypothetical protein [Anaerolineales bacterium]